MTKYDDIIHLPHHVSPARPRMAALDRAAQFAPFAALTGFGEVISETARPTQARTEQDEDRLAELDAAMQLLLCRGGVVRIVYFRADPRKEGGSYVTAEGECRRIDAEGRALVLQDGTRIDLPSIVSIERA